MPAKGKKHGKARYSLQKAKGQSQPPAVARTTSAQKIPQPSAVAAPAPKASVREASYPFIGAELRLIGILSGIILVILIVLALVLP